MINNIECYGKVSKNTYCMQTIIQVFQYAIMKVNLSHSHTIATTSRRPVAADNHQQLSATNFQPKF